jgi:hypothetical protein
MHPLHLVPHIGTNAKSIPCKLYGRARGASGPPAPCVLTHASNVYSVGAMLVTLLTGNFELAGGPVARQRVRAARRLPHRRAQHSGARPRCLLHAA